MRVEIHGTRLPGSTFAGYEDVRVGLRTRDEVVELVAGDAQRAFWSVDVRVRELDDGTFDFTGPAVAGRRGDRSVKLAWLDGSGELFRAAKLRLDRVALETVADALRNDRTLVATVTLTDAKGGPTCASVPDTLISWSTTR